MRSIAPVNEDFDEDAGSSSSSSQMGQGAVEDDIAGRSSGQILREDAELNSNRPHEAIGDRVSVGSSRLFTLELSPCHHNSSCRYEITNDGVFGQS